MRAESIRNDLILLMRARPYEKFVLAFEDGDKIIVEHPENVAFDPVPGSSHRVHIIGSGALRYTTLDAITMVLTLDKFVPINNGDHATVGE